jgi:GAF domain-containing protein/HAMP domain-containing protein
MKEPSVSTLLGNLNSLRFRLAIGFALIGILTSAMATTLSYLQARNNLFQEKQDKLLAIVSNAALQISGDDHSLLRSPADMETEIYQELQRKSFAIAGTDDEILYVYTMRKNEQGDIYFVLDAGHEPESTFDEYEPGEIGLVYEDPSGLLLKNFDALDKPIVEPDFYTDEFGTYLTAYAPIYTSDGAVDSIMGVDILAQDIVAQQMEFFNTFILLFALSASVSALIGWFSGSLISKPVLDLANIAANIKSTSDKIKIRTGIKEVGQLVKSFNNMIGSLRENEERLQQQANVLDLQNEELQTSLQRLDKRANQFKAITQIVSATSSLESLQTLLPRTTDVISEQFGFYHAGIFLLDEKREFAVLRAANSTGGRRMLERGHKLKVGQTGIVGFVTAAGVPRIALDVGADATFFGNPDLPDTRSEMALPLRIAGEVIGALDVQSTEPNAFQSEDIEVLTTLANQVAIAIQNARSYETMQALTEKAQKASAASLQDAWRTLQTQEDFVGYRVSDEGLTPLTQPVSSAQIKKAVNSKETVAETGEIATLAIPIRLRDEVIGVMDIRVPDRHEWDPDEVDVAEAVAERLSLALETSLLLRSTQRRAEIERITADISGRIGATTQFNSILKTAAEELSRVLGGSEVLVQIQPEAISDLGK